jgi:hypothetical protein
MLVFRGEQDAVDRQKVRWIFFGEERWRVEMVVSNVGESDWVGFDG